MKRLIGPFLVLALVSFFALLWFKEGLLPVNLQDTTPQVFVINEGETVDSIARRLEKEGLIRNKSAFRIQVRLMQLEKKIQFGDFRLSKSLSALQIAQELTHGTVDRWVTLIEGLRVEEIAAILSKDFPISETEFIEKARPSEGYLFPDTYLIPKGADTDFILTLLKDTFLAKTAQLRSVIEERGDDFNEVLILASLVERETQSYDDKKLVAGILYNRLEEGMPLQIDATVQYALGYSLEEKSWWRKNLTLDDLELDSLYNTYSHNALPPAPICNPGMETIEAVANYTPSDYFYYITDKQGNMHYAKTLEEHNRNVEKYL